MLAQPFKVQLTCNPQEYSDVRTELDDIWGDKQPDEGLCAESKLSVTPEEQLLGSDSASS